jgi:Uma2 family endonuclease
MESAVLSKKSPAKNGNIHLRIGGWEIQNLRPAMTDGEFEEFCFKNPGLRIEQDKHGNIIIMSPVSYDSGNHESEVLIDLGIWNRKHKLGKTFSPSTLFILPDGEKRMPDAAWVSMEKHLKLTPWERKKFAHVVPDFIVEVRSPNDDIRDLKGKISAVWMANGVRLAWLIDPIDEVSFVFKPGTPPVEVKGLGNMLSGKDVLPGFEFDLSILKES